MRPSWIPPVLTFAFLVPTLALPHGGSDFCQRPPPSTVTVTSTTTLIPGYVTGSIPVKPTEPHQHDDPHQHDVPTYTTVDPSQHDVPTYTPVSYTSTTTSETTYPTLPPYPVYNSTTVGPTGTAGPTEVPWPPVETDTSSVIPPEPSSSVEPVSTASCRPSPQYFDRIDKAPSVGEHMNSPSDLEYSADLTSHHRHTSSSFPLCRLLGLSRADYRSRDLQELLDSTSGALQDHVLRQA